MWFRNLIVLRVPTGWELDLDSLADALRPLTFAEPTSVEEARVGWVPPFEGEPSLVYALGPQFLVSLREERKLLPARVVAQFVRQRVEQIEAAEGFRPGRKRIKALKEEVRDALLPRAFSLARDTRAWIDPIGGWLAVDTASQTRADEVVAMLAKALGGFPGRPLRTTRSPASSMTQWLIDDAAPAGLTIDQDVVLKARDGKATVRYANQSLDPQDVSRHTQAGKQCTALALTWRDRVSFMLTETLAIRRLRPLDVLTQTDEGGARDADAHARFASDFALMTAELSSLLSEVVDALGGPLADARRDGSATGNPGSAPST
jgi:recombination associated protein RdgC